MRVVPNLTHLNRSGGSCGLTLTYDQPIYIDGWIMLVKCGLRYRVGSFFAIYISIEVIKPILGPIQTTLFNSRSMS